MAGFGRFSAPRRVLHKTVPSEGNTGSAERRGSVSFSVSLPMETTGCTLSVLSDDTGEIRNYAVYDGKITLSCEELCGGACDGLFFYKFIVKPNREAMRSSARQTEYQIRFGTGATGLTAPLFLLFTKKEIILHRGFTAELSIIYLSIDFSEEAMSLAARTL